MVPPNPIDVVVVDVDVVVDVSMDMVDMDSGMVVDSVMEVDSVTEVDSDMEVDLDMEVDITVDMDLVMVDITAVAVSAFTLVLAVSVFTLVENRLRPMIRKRPKNIHLHIDNQPWGPTIRIPNPDDLKINVYTLFNLFKQFM